MPRSLRYRHYLPGGLGNCGPCGAYTQPATTTPGGKQWPTLWCACASPANPVTATALKARAVIRDFSIVVTPEILLVPAQAPTRHSASEAPAPDENRPAAEPRTCRGCSYLPGGLGSCGPGAGIHIGQPPFVMGIAHCFLGPYCACASPAKPARATEANAKAAITDFSIVVTPEF